MAELTKGIHDLIERIKEDGIHSGEEARDEIVKNAREEAERLIADAHEEAEAIRKAAKDEAQGLHIRTEAALKLAGKEFLTTFRHDLRRRHVRPLITDNLAALLADEAFLGTAVTQLFRDYVAGGGRHITVVVKPEMKQRLSAWFAAQLEDLLASEAIDVETESGLEGFRMQRDEEGFFWDFTLEAVAEALRDLIDPALKPYLELDTRRGGTT